MNILDVNLSLIIPELILASSIVLCSIVAIYARFQVYLGFVLTQLGYFIAAVYLIFFKNTGGEAFHGLVYSSAPQDQFQLLVLLASFLTSFMLWDSYKKGGGWTIEAFIILMGASLGGIIALSSQHYLSLIIGLEMLSLLSYVLIALNKSSLESIRAAFKYFIIGALSSALLFMGIAFMYGATGELIYGARIFPSGALNSHEQNLYLAGAIFFIVAILTKLAAAPFHFWAPDVYENSPSALNAFLLSVPKIVLFVVLYRFILSPLLSNRIDYILMAVANLSLIIGSSMAFLQKDVKRLLAFSSVIHTGYLLLLIVFSAGGVVKLLYYYQLSYLVGTFGLFGVLISIESPLNNKLTLSNLNGLFKASLPLTLLLVLFVLSTAGVPLTPGFIAKVFLFNQISYSGIYQLIFALFISLLSVGFYLSFITNAIKGNSAVRLDSGFSLKVSLSLSLIVAISMVIWPVVYNNLFYD